MVFSFSFSYANLISVPTPRVRYMPSPFNTSISLQTANIGDDRYCKQKQKDRVPKIGFQKVKISV